MCGNWDMMGFNAAPERRLGKELPAALLNANVSCNVQTSR
jgi:hypothetical protein